MPTTFFAYSFRNPLGNGFPSAESDGDGLYVAFGFDEPNPEIGGSHHQGADWKGQAGGNTDLGVPVYAIGNGAVFENVSDQDCATTRFGDYVFLLPSRPYPTLINGQWVTQVNSPYAYLETIQHLCAVSNHYRVSASVVDREAGPMSSNRSFI